MATMQSTITRFRPSSTGVRPQPDLVGTAVTTRRQPTPQMPLLKEPEDARLTGGTRSLARRLLALNLAGSRAKSTVAKPEPVRPAPSPERALPPLHAAVA
jgi:hypothetical protein